MRKHVLAEAAESKIGLDTCSSKSKVTVTTHAARKVARRVVLFFGGPVSGEIAFWSDLPLCASVQARREIFHVLSIPRVSLLCDGKSDRH